MVILNENIPNVAAPQDIWTLLRNTIDNKFVIFTVPFFCNHAYLAVFKSNDSNSPCHVGQLQNEHPSLFAHTASQSDKEHIPSSRP